MSLRVVLMGTGTFALPAFQAICQSRHTVAGIVTQPDRRGRGHHRHSHPVRELGEQFGVAVFQPENVNTSESLKQLRTFQADVFVVAAYGQILSRELLDIPRWGAFNLHASLLPKYRGAAPILYAILDGETETGVTIFQIVPQLDAGPILGRVRTEIDPEETTGQLHDRLADLAAPLTLRILDQIDAGTVQPTDQPDSGVTFAPKINKSFGQIDWSRSASEIHRHVRAMQPWPMPYTFLPLESGDPLRLLVLKVRTAAEESSTAPPGSIIVGESDRMFVATGSGMLEILQLQPAGKKAMSAQDFLRGRTLPPRTQFMSLPPA